MKPTTMKGGGYYDQHSSIQKNTNAKTIPHLQMAAALITLPEDSQPFCLVDFGSSEGKNSQDCIEAVVGGLLKRNGRQTIVIVHNDLPSNDFNRLFNNVHEDDSYYRRHKKLGAQIFVFGCAGSFYEQVMPCDSVHLGFSSWACQWLSQSPPIELKDHIYFGGAKGDSRAVFAQQAHSDLVTFLSLRALELKSGGKLVLVIPMSLGDPTDNTAIAGGAMNLINDHLQKLVGEGLIAREKYEAFVFPFYFRTKEETLKAIADKTSPLSTSFTVDEVKEESFSCPFYADYLQTKDIQQYANRYVSWLKAWSEPIISSAIFSSDAALVDLFYDRIQEDVRQKPDNYIFRVSVLFLILTKL